MRNEKETFQASRTDPIWREIAEVRESVELTRSDIRRTKNDIEQYQGAHESHVRRTRALWVIVILLLAGAAGLLWYGSPLLKEHRGLLSNMPLLQSALNGIDARVMGAEGQIGQLANQGTGYSD